MLEAGPWPRIFFGVRGGEGGPRRKNYLEEVKQGMVPMTFWADEDFYDEPVATRLGVLDARQSRATARRASTSWTRSSGMATASRPSSRCRLFRADHPDLVPADGLVLDPFAGSGTTGHAVLALNADAWARSAGSS